MSSLEDQRYRKTIESSQRTKGCFTYSGTIRIIIFDWSYEENRSQRQSNDTFKVLK